MRWPSWRADRAVRDGPARSSRAGWLAVCIVACAPAQAALRLDTDPAGLDPEALRASTALIAAAQATLPPALGGRMDRVVRVRWRADLPEDVHGRTRGGEIGLRRALLDAWMQRPAGSAVRQGADPATRAGLAALLHEVAHVYDRGGARVSSQPRLLDLAGWQVRPLRFGLRSRRNDFRDRSPDRYELTSPAEFFAVNFEYFLLDPQYACRRPALHRLLSAHFGWAPPGAACAPGFPYVSADPEGGAAELLQLDPARVYAVDYLLAEGNERPMSRWGHGMLRLVVCAPGRDPGPDCRLDLDHHRVLSFRAYVDDVQISSWRGLTGRYPSRLFVLPLQQVVDEYTKRELRGLQSVPLRLDRAAISGILERAARLHWSYDGRYYFVTNNCAVEAWKLLRDGVPALADEPLRSMTPNGLLRRLERAGIADDSVLADREVAVRDGYRFESLSGYFSEMLAVAAAAQPLPADDVPAWFALDPAQRTPLLQRAGLRDGAALLLLEHAALRREELLARDVLKRAGHGAEHAGDGDGTATLRHALRALLQDAAYTGRPALLLAGTQGAGYGVPQATERDRLRRALEQRGPSEQATRTALLARARDLLPATQRARLAKTESNVALIGERLRELAVTGDEALPATPPDTAPDASLRAD